MKLLYDSIALYLVALGEVKTRQVLVSSGTSNQICYHKKQHCTFTYHMYINAFPPLPLMRNQHMACHV